MIGRLMDNMNTGLMIGLVIGVCGWLLLFNRRPGGNSRDAEKADKTDGEKPEP